MRRSSALISVATAVTALCVVSTSAQRQAARPRVAELTLTLNTPKSDLLRLEPIPLVIVLENRTDLPVFGHAVLRFSSGRIDVEVSRSRGKRWLIDQLTTSVRYTVVQGRHIQPGERFETAQTLFVDLDRAFPAQGRYGIRVRLRKEGDAPELWSNSVSIRISEPDGLDKEAYQFMLATGRARTFLTGLHGQAPQEEEDLVRFAEIYADTPYGDYAALALGRRALAKGDLQSARDYFTRVIANPSLMLDREAVAAVEAAGLKARRNPAY